jgi:riboflavin kinase / FMN adenylyltransferase
VVAPGDLKTSGTKAPMRIFRHVADVPPAFHGAVVAIGNFDGVHLGHQALIGKARQHARALDAPLAVLSFEPSPREFLQPGGEPFKLTPFRSKAHLVAMLGADALFALAFDAELAHKSAPDFVIDLLVRGLRVGCVVVGSDFRFGSGRTGTTSVLSYMGEMEGFGVDIFPTLMAGIEEKISSTLIRRIIKEGRPDDAARLLGHPFVIEGRVEHGEKRGRTLGFPTINMSLYNYIRPAYGIYAVRVSVIADDQVVSRHDGVANLGVRPMYLANEPLLETHLFDFNGDLYGKHVGVELVSFIRPEAKFASVDALRAQIARDVAKAKEILGTR